MTDQRTYGQWWDTAGERVDLAIADVERIGAAGFAAAGATPEAAAFLVEIFLDKAIQGDHTRGVRLLLETIARAHAGDVDVAPTIEVRGDRPGTAVVSAGPRASGDLVCRDAMALAVDKARACGVGVVTARAQCRILTPYLRQATDAGMVGLAMAQSVPLVAPLGGYRPLLGNAPFGIGIPTAEREPFLLDMSLTQSSNKGVVEAAREGVPVPEGVLLDEHGNPTTDSAEYLDDELTARWGGICPKGSLVPLGGGHKGYAMILAVGVLTTLLADASPPWDLHYHLDERGSFGTVFAVIEPGGFRADGTDGAHVAVDALLDTVKASPRREGADEILYPGERSQRMKRERRDTGRVHLPTADVSALAALAAELDEDPPA